jgi:quercetin dioxygenase-like cupin family protein
MAKESSVNFYRWDDMEAETVTEEIDRRLVVGERSMLAKLFLKKGSVVPRHHHDNEQFTLVLDGALHFKIGADGEEEVTVRKGEVLHIPSNVPHEALALEDTWDLDVFTPIRQDWLDGTDSYFHRK